MGDIAQAGSGSDREKLSPKVTDEVFPLRIYSFSVRNEPYSVDSAEF